MSDHHLAAMALLFAFFGMHNILSTRWRSEGYGRLGAFVMAFVTCIVLLAICYCLSWFLA